MTTLGGFPCIIFTHGRHGPAIDAMPKSPDIDSSLLTKAVFDVITEYISEDDHDQNLKTSSLFAKQKIIDAIKQTYITPIPLGSVVHATDPAGNQSTWARSGTPIFEICKVIETIMPIDLIIREYAFLTRPTSDFHSVIVGGHH